MRSTNPEFQIKIDNIIKTLLQDFKINYLNFTSIDDAVKIIEQANL